MNRPDKKNLSGIEVLLDSYDLAIPEGTGIKSYSLQLLSVLKELGANTELLVSSSTHADPLIMQSMLYDCAERKEQALLEWSQFLNQRIKFNLCKAVHIPPLNGKNGPLAPDSAFPHHLGCSVIPNCYRAAGDIQEKQKIISSFRTSKNYHIWHATQPLPLRHKKAIQITTVHDLIPLLYPHLCDAKRPLFYQRVKESLRHSRAVAVVSEKTKKDLLNNFEVAEEKIIVTPLFSRISGEACNPRILDMAMKAFDLELQKYILYVGTVETRKNIRRLIEAYLSLGSDQTLILAGKHGWRCEEELKVLTHIKQQPGADVRLLSHVPEAMLPALYQGASCLAFPSLAEGFGLPPLEAMTSGCPVVCSSTSSLPEVGGDAVEYVDPLSVESIARGLGKVISDPVHRQSLVEKGRLRALDFSREHCAVNIIKLYNKALA